MLRSTQSAEKPVLLWHYHVYLFDGNWWNLNAEKQGHAEKHTICWKACFVVALCRFFLWTWNFNAAKQIMLRSTQSADFFWRKWWKLKCRETTHAEKHKICWKKHVLWWHVFFWWKTIKLLMFDWGTFKKHPNWLKGMVDLFLYMFWFSLCWEALFCWEAITVLRSTEEQT